MAERAPHLTDEFSNPTSNNQIQTLTLPAFQSGTYVVQIPKDQVYRVPPPENARFVERLSIPVKNSKRKKCCSPFFCCCSITISIIILIGLAITISFLFLRPKDPKFSIQNVLVKQKNYPTYNITLNVNNRNPKAGIIYKQGGHASLSFRQQEIATGKYPKFYQERDSSSLIGVLLDGSKFVLPKEIEKSRKSRGIVSLSLNMDVPISLKNGIFGAKNAKLVVACDLTVDKLAKGGRVISEACQTD
ncbi:hypothetical protein HS088_TW11G00280 [Tripterygium wilfordii]|uniref:Late embryogenesis abundant protein LEA-2 subgroup domain-containing protein n=1 Tax=Tripterygium wilfordii TaxID=458696 RepID=A0A7J7D1K3_TRIWF|nr:NDR1/HIN1-like protein 13 [Tripterygium wilfordii]KAF5740214.1 hypothetical protein HS088_TW11G00280 [Tripterygium wilfordii]